MMKRNIKLVGAFGLLSFLFLLGSSMAYEDEVFAENQYIDDVCQGVHPDYKSLGVTCGK